MKIKISRFPFEYWGDLHPQEFFQKNPQPGMWENCNEIGTRCHGKKLSFKEYLSVEDNYVSVIKNLISVFQIKHLTFAYKQFVDFEAGLKLTISTNQSYNGIDCGFLMSLKT